MDDVEVQAEREFEEAVDRHLYSSREPRGAEEVLCRIGAAVHRLRGKQNVYIVLSPEGVEVEDPEWTRGEGFEAIGFFESSTLLEALMEAVRRRDRQLSEGRKGS